MTKLLIASALLLGAPMAAHAACSASDFSIQGFTVTANSGRMSMKGKLDNHCATPAAAQIEVQAKDASGNVVASRKAWPAGTTNIAPGKSISFNLGRQFHYDPSMQTYTASIASVHTW